MIRRQQKNLHLLAFLKGHIIQNQLPGLLDGCKHLVRFHFSPPVKMKV
jgi:hypothetical protein